MNAALTSAGGCIGKLPVDVFRHILGTLDPEDDKDTLSACSLVSQTWSDLAQPILFYSAKISGKVLHLVEQLCLALNDEFRTYLPVILPGCIQVLSDAERCNDYTYVLDILHTLEVFGG